MIFDRPPSYRAHRTTILINEEDFKFLKARGFKATNLLRKKIHELKMREEGSSIDWEQAAERLRAQLERVCEKMGQVLTEEQFKQIMS